MACRRFASRSAVRASALIASSSSPAKPTARSPARGVADRDDERIEIVAGRLHDFDHAIADDVAVIDQDVVQRDAPASAGQLFERDHFDLKLERLASSNKHTSLEQRAFDCAADVRFGRLRPSPRLVELELDCGTPDTQCASADDCRRTRDRADLGVDKATPRGGRVTDERVVTHVERCRLLGQRAAGQTEDQYCANHRRRPVLARPLTYHVGSR